MHIINGNIPHGYEQPIQISLSDRIPHYPHPNTPSHPTTGSRPLRLHDLLFPETITDHIDPVDDPIPIQVLLRYRPPQTTPSLTASPILPTMARRPLHQRSGRRRTIRVNHRTIISYKTPKPQRRYNLSQPSPPTTPQGTVEIRNSQNSELTAEATLPAPPPSGAPGVVSTTNEECKPLPFASSSLSGRGSRAVRRRLYRQWRKARREKIWFPSLGKKVASKGTPQQAAKRKAAGNTNAKLFRHLVLEHSTHKGPQRGKQRKPMTTPRVSYGAKIQLGTQNVQGIAELLKHQQCLDMMTSGALDILFLTETKTTSYYTYNSQGHLFIINGSTKDKYGGVIAIVSPALRPFIKDIFQHSTRILQIVVSCHSGDSHYIGVYAPHDKLDYETVKLPFWQQLQSIVDSIPQPEPVFIIGDWNVRLQGRKQDEHHCLGPFVYGKGPNYAKTGEERNRNLFLNFLNSTDTCDAITFKTPDLLQHVTYRDKSPPPADWGLFALDSIRLLQFWDKVAGLPIREEDSLLIGQNIRSFLTEDPLMQTTPLRPRVDPYRFQSLDKLIVRRKWLPSVHQCRANHTTGFPSDHYLLAATLQVKLGARPPTAPRPPKLEYNVDESTRQQFCQTFRSAYVRPRVELPVPQLEYFVYTDGSGSKGCASTSTPAGWGVYIKQGHSEIEGYGRVNTDYSSPYFLDARVGSNNTGELTALIEAMLYLLHDTVKSSIITIYYDSKWAAQMVRGRARPKRHATMVDHARRIYARLQEKSEVRWEWVKGHSGVAGNARADALAERGKNSTRSEGLRYAQKPPLLIADITNQPLDYPSTRNKYQKILHAVKTAEQLHFRPQEHVPKQPWITQDTLHKLHHAKHLKALEDPAYYTYYKEVKKQARKEKREWIRGQFGSDGKLTQGTWHMARRLKKGFQERKRRLVVNGKQVPWSKTHEAFATHLATIQWAPSSVTDEEIAALRETTPLYPQDLAALPYFTMEELQRALGKTRRGKAPGPDGLRPDPILLLDHFGELRLLDIMNECWHNRTVPQEWKDAQVISFYKGKGDDSSTVNYRPIALLNALYKLYATMVQHRMATAYDDRIRSNQYGFRKNRGTENPLFILRRLQDYSSRTGVPFHCLFIDWKQAFDKVDHAAMLTAITRLGVHEHYVDVIRDIYTDPTFHTVGLTGEKSFATPHTGIRQGCPLSPYLFIIVLSVILEDVDGRLRTHGVPTNTWSVGKPVYDLEYADDTLLFGVSTDVVEEYLCHLQSEASLYGLLLNLEKTELLNHPNRQSPPPSFIDGTQVQTNDQVKYLGSLFSWHKPTLTALQHRIALANTAFNKLTHLWRSSLSRKAKVHIFLANIVPVLLHGVPTLTMENKHFAKVDSWFFAHLRRVLGIKASYYSHITNKEVWLQAGRPVVPSQMVLAAQFRLLLSSLNASPQEPMHHVAFSPGLKDRVSCYKNHKTGPPPPHWLSLVFGHAMEYYSHFIGNDSQYQNSIHGLKLYILRYNNQFPAKLLAAPTRHSSVFSLYRQSIGSAWQA